MQRRSLLAGLAAATGLAACDIAPGPERGRLIVLRHTERTGENLNPAGIARAAALPAALAGMPIDAVFAPDRQRNIDTARPLATARGLEVQTIPAVNIARAMFKRHPGQTVVWVGNKDNLADLWDEIAAHGAPPIHYGEVFLVSMDGLSAGRIERRRFGG